MKEIIKKDIEAYAREYGLLGDKAMRLEGDEVMRREDDKAKGFALFKAWLHLMLHNRSFRSLYYARKGKLSKLYSWLLPGEPTLHIPFNNKICGGVMFFHSYGTIISPIAKVGEGCRITCNITIGYKDGKSPIIGKNVEILPGAVIAGYVTIGDNCVIGPNAVVYKSVPANCVVVGNPAYILKRDGKVVREEL